MSLLNEYSDEEFENIIKISNSYRDLSRNLGYKSNSSDLANMIKKRITELEIDTSHFLTVKKGTIQRTPENIFIENSTASQRTLRLWYRKGEYTSYICSICGQKPIWQGKDLTLILDHINGINNDDRLENLRWVCPNCNQQLDTTNGKNIKKNKKKYYCVDCGKEISEGSTRCIDCYSKSRIITEDQMAVTREELKNLIRSTPFTKIGEKYNVTDNAVRKWCDKYGLPRRVSDIKKYSDEDWAKI